MFFCFVSPFCVSVENIPAVCSLETYKKDRTKISPDSIFAKNHKIDF
jgi:hypothetical protein